MKNTLYRIIFALGLLVSGLGYGQTANVQKSTSNNRLTGPLDVSTQTVTFADDQIPVGKVNGAASEANPEFSGIVKINGGSSSGGGTGQEDRYSLQVAMRNVGGTQYGLSVNNGPSHDPYFHINSNGVGLIGNDAGFVPFFSIEEKPAYTRDFRMELVPAGSYSSLWAKSSNFAGAPNDLQLWANRDIVIQAGRNNDNTTNNVAKFIIQASNGVSITEWGNSSSTNNRTDFDVSGGPRFFQRNGSGVVTNLIQTGAASYIGVPLVVNGNSYDGYSGFQLASGFGSFGPDARIGTSLAFGGYARFGHSATDDNNAYGFIQSASGESLIGFGGATLKINNVNGAIAEFNDSGLTMVKPITGTIRGTGTNNNASAGIVGEYIESKVVSGSAVSLTTATSANVTSISLTAGDWDVEGSVNVAAVGGTFTSRGAGINTTSATIPTDGSELLNTTLTTAQNVTIPFSATRVRISVSSTTTVYLVTRATFAAGTVTAYGQITARRVR